MKRFLKPLLPIFAISLLFASAALACVAGKQFQVNTGGTLTTSLLYDYKLEDATDFFGSLNLTNNGSSPFNAAKVNNGWDGGASNSTRSLTSTTTYNGALSISLWVKLETELSADNTGYMFASTGLPANFVGQYILYFQESGIKKITFNRIRQNVSNDEYQYVITMGTTNWYNLVYTYDGSNVRAYVNGSLVGGPIASSGNGTGGGVPPGYSIGYDSGNTRVTNSWTKGIIDEVEFWSRALTTTEITDLYNSGSGQTMVNTTCSATRRKVMLIP